MVTVREAPWRSWRQGGLPLTWGRTAQTGMRSWRSGGLCVIIAHLGEPPWRRRGLQGEAGSRWGQIDGRTPLGLLPSDTEPGSPEPGKGKRLSHSLPPSPSRKGSQRGERAAMLSIRRARGTEPSRIPSSGSRGGCLFRPESRQRGWRPWALPGSWGTCLGLSDPQSTHHSGPHRKTNSLCWRLNPPNPALGTWRGIYRVDTKAASGERRAPVQSAPR